jgi:DNA polymerase
MNIMSVDIETYSSVDLVRSGVYAYSASPDFEILLFGYAFNDDPVKVIDLAGGEKLPAEVLEALKNPDVIKSAYNAMFERVCINRYFEEEYPVYQPIPPGHWQCTMVHALTLGLPLGLGAVAKALKMKQQKDSAGKALIRYFSMPCKPTKANDGRTRNLPEHDPEKWEQYKAYNAQDVEVERELRKILNRYPVPAKEWELWELDQAINDRGVAVDQELVRNATECDSSYQDELYKEAQEITGLENPNSVAQLKDWIKKVTGEEIKSLNKKKVKELKEETDCSTVKKVLGLRQRMAKTSVKKYEAMERALCPDGRVRGLFQFYGANRTGRWAGRLVQVQNLPRNSLSDLDLARQIVKEGNFELLELLYDSVPNVLSQLIRTALIPAPDHRFIVADFSAIEARVIAWLAGEQWRMDVFNSHGKIYEASAAHMFRVPIEEITKDSPLRQKGKIAELALGYGGSVGALKAMGALEMGLEENELPELVSTWRASNPSITQFWWEVGNAAMKAVQDKTAVQVHHGIEFSFESGGLFLRLPSGRRLCYVQPQIRPHRKFNRPTLTYMGVTQGRNWGRIETYGPKLVENIVQATARDCLAEALLRLDQAGYKIVMHVHDEAVLEMPEGAGSLEEACEIMAQPLEWAPGLPLPADGFETEYYKKD